MGFWQALDAGLTARIEEKTRKEERQQEIDLRTAEREEQRKYERELFMEQVKQDRITAALTTRQKTYQETATAEREAAADAAAFLSRLEGVDDPRVAALANSPLVAANLERELRKIEITAASSGLRNMPLLRGEALLELTTVSLPEGGVAPVELPSIDDILGRDLGDEEAYFTTMQEVSQKPVTGTATLNPAAYYVPDPEVLEEGRKAFDQAVLRAANSAMTAAQQQGDAGLSANLRAKIEGYREEGSAERFELMDMFGQQAFASLTEMDNPYIQDIQSDPMLFDYSFVRIANEEEYNALPSGTRYLHPDGSVKRKM
jgi:hypothetical protein